MFYKAEYKSMNGHKVTFTQDGLCIPVGVLSEPKEERDYTLEELRNMYTYWHAYIFILHMADKIADMDDDAASLLIADIQEEGRKRNLDVDTVNYARHWNEPFTDGMKRYAELSNRLAKEWLVKTNPRGGYVYLLQSASGHYKIGRTKNPKNRIKTFGIMLPFEVEYLALIPTTDMYSLEEGLHGHFSERRINGEWFDLTADDVQFLKDMGI